MLGYVVSSRVSSSWLFICVGAGSVRRLDNAWKSEASTHKSALWERTIRLCRSLVCHRFCRLVAFPWLLSESWFLTPNISRLVNHYISAQCFWSTYAAGKLMIWLNMYFPASRSVTAGLLVCFRFVEMCAKTTPALAFSLPCGHSRPAVGRVGRSVRKTELWVTCLFYIGRHFPVSQWEKVLFSSNTGGSVKLQQPDKFSLMISLSSSDTSPLYIRWRFGLLLTKSATVRKHQTCARVRMPTWMYASLASLWLIRLLKPCWEIGINNSDYNHISINFFRKPSLKLISWPWWTFSSSRLSLACWDHVNQEVVE